MKKIIVLILINIIPAVAFAQRENSFDDQGILIKIWNYVALPLALFLSIVAVIISVLHKKSKTSSAPESSIKALKQELSSLRSDLNNRIKYHDFKELIQKVREIEDKIAQLDQPRVMEWRNNRDENDALISDDQDDAQKFAQSNKQLYYAKHADLDNGFSANIISTTQNGEQVYEIETDGDTAVYHITGDINAQRYALTDAAYALKKACDFLNEPYKGCQIILRQEGRLIKTSGNWIIQQRAKIEFK